MTLLRLKSQLQYFWGILKKPASLFKRTLGHEDIIVLLAKILKPKIYVELGLYECRLFNKMIPFVRDRLIGVDINSRASKFMKHNPKTEFYGLSTDKFVNRLKEEKLTIDMLFIDADHSKEAVLRDFKNYFPFVRDQGIILLHDGYPKDAFHTQKGLCGDGYKAIFELSKVTKDFEMVTLPFHPGLTICRKRIKQVPWLEQNEEV